MKTLISMWLDGLPPSVNHLYNRGMKRVYINPEAKAWREYAAAAMKTNRTHPTAPPTRSLVRATIRFITHDHRRWDIDNRLKNLFDCLVKAKVIFDDSQIYKLNMEREDIEGADLKTFIEVKEL